MSEINIQEKTASRKWGGKDGDTLKVDYKITGTEDSLRAYIEFCCFIQSRFRKREGLFLQTMDVDARPDPDTPFTAHATWSTDNMEVPVFTGDTTSGKEHITQPIQNVACEPGNVQVEIFGINQQPGEEPKGCDIIAPRWQHSVKVSRLRIFTPDSYFAALHRMTGTVNNAPFWFFKRGEILFKGATWETKYQRDKLGNLHLWINFTYQFEASPNKIVEDRQLGNVPKEGFHYLWYRYEDKKAGNVIAKKPAFVVVDQVYEYTDFSFFGFEGP